MAKVYQESALENQELLQLLLSKDTEMIKAKFNADYAQLIIKEFENCSQGLLLTNAFFDLYPVVGGKELVLNFITVYLNFNDESGSGMVYSSQIPMLTKTKEYHINLMEDIFLKAKLGKVSIEGLVSSILRLAAANPGHYTSLESLILKCAAEDFFLRESFEEICGKTCPEREYLVTHLSFKPITMSPKLISDESRDVDPIIKNIRTNFLDQEKESLINILIEGVGKLKTDPKIAKILTIAAKNSEIYIVIKDELECCGGVYLPSNKQIFVYLDRVGVVCNLMQVVNILAHESTHCFIDYAYHNYASPFRIGDENTKLAQEVLVKKIWSDLVAFMAVQEGLDELSKDSRLGFNEFRLKFYSQEQHIFEIPAYFIEEIAIRILNSAELLVMRGSIILQHSVSIMSIIDDALVASGNNELNETISSAIGMILPENAMQLVGLYSELVEL